MLKSYFISIILSLSGFLQSNIIDDNKYKGELYPANYIEKNSKMFWDDYFQTDREDNIKGIVQINLGTFL